MQAGEGIIGFFRKQTWIVRACFYICLAMTLGGIVFLRFSGVANLSKGTCLSLGADIVAMAISTVLLYSCKQDRNLDSNYTKIFVMLITMTSVLTFTDLASWLVQDAPELRTWNIIITTANYTSESVLRYFFFRYVIAQLELEGKLVNVITRIMNYLMIPVLILNLANLFYPVYFYVDSMGVYSRTDLYLLSHVYNLITVLVALGGMIVSTVPVKTKIISASFILIPVATNLVTGINQEITARHSAMLVSIVLIYGVLFAEREKTLITTEDELAMANNIQASVIPNIFPAFPERQEFDVYGSMDAAKEVGGDFFDFFFIDKNHLAMVMADVSGKGIPAALFMMSAKIIINDRAMMGGTPAEILEYANARICAKNEEGMFVTVWLGILDITTGELTCANAGHEYPCFCRNGEFELYKDLHGFVVGGDEDEEYEDYEIKLEPGDYIFLYTDGLPEANNAKGELFGNDRMMEVLNRGKDLPPRELLELVKKSVADFEQGEPQFDDLTMLAVKYKGIAKSVVITARRDKLYDAMDFIDMFLSVHKCSEKSLMEIEVAVEEIFINIASYAYPEGQGDVLMEAEVDGSPEVLTLRFKDKGIPYDPLAKEDPDTTLSVEDAPIGGLGIYMLKQSMDEMFYEYKDGQNILTIKKQL